MNEFALPENLARDLYRQQGADRERERIIALIFNEEDLAVSSEIADWYYAGNDDSKDDAIALIKGEQK